MRGDRPGAPLFWAWQTPATPHARGSTCRGRKDPALGVGYPACAGIDPSRAALAVGGKRLPRMRGDRPHSSSFCTSAPMATPHARGSTFHHIKRVTQNWGYPACAGIDRQTTPPRDATKWLPRMRGDRPHGEIETAHIQTATPHARGSTSGPRRHLAAAGGYPACAGIDPSGVLVGSVVDRLPRMRGDRPFRRFGGISR